MTSKNREEIDYGLNMEMLTILYLLELKSHVPYPKRSGPMGEKRNHLRPIIMDLALFIGNQHDDGQNFNF